MDQKLRLWGGRFGDHNEKDAIMEEFNQSINFDKELWRVDLEGSLAYAESLQSQNLISQDELAEMQRGLRTVLDEWNVGNFVLNAGDEDIHTANERRLGEIIGRDIAGKLHTGRSRNDQVATDLRMWLREQLRLIAKAVLKMISTLNARAGAEIDVIFPGYTHLQRAQPIRWSHWLLSYVAGLRRDYDRIIENFNRVNICPLGSGALAGNPFCVDRVALANKLGFHNGVTLNSLDAVSDRDFVAETLFVNSMIMTRLSRFAEDLIIYSSKEFGFVTLSDTYSTGSSLMPQKKNPDSLELIRGKFGRCIGSLVSLLSVLKGLPSTYNKDMQEDKEALFDSIRTIKACLHIANAVVDTLKIHPEKMKNALNSEMLATDLAYFLVRKGVSFRDAHELAGKVVRKTEEDGIALHDIDPTTLKSIHHLLSEDVSEIWNFATSVDQYTVLGGTAKSAVESQIQDTLQWIQSRNNN